MKVNINGNEFYIDGIEKDNLDLVKKKVKYDWDMVFICGGTEGAGKSTKIFQVAYYISDGRFTLDHVCFNVKDFQDKILKHGFLQPGDALVLDESFVLNSRASMTETTRQFLAIMSECRQKNLFLFIIIPNFFDLDKNLALWRSRGLYYIYHDRMDRGYFKFYAYEKKKRLYIEGKRFYNYDCVKPNFSGRFTKFVPFDMDEYRKRKLKAFELRDRTKSENRFLRQRNILMLIIIEVFKGTIVQIAKEMTKRGEKITFQGVSKAINTLDKENSTFNLSTTTTKLTTNEEYSDGGEDEEEEDG